MQQKKVFLPPCSEKNRQKQRQTQQQQQHQKLNRQIESFLRLLVGLYVGKLEMVERFSQAGLQFVLSLDVFSLFHLRGVYMLTAQGWAGNQWWETSLYFSKDSSVLLIGLFPRQFLHFSDSAFKPEEINLANCCVSFMHMSYKRAWGCVRYSY